MILPNTKTAPELPAIIVDFDEPGICTWHTCGWSNDSGLLAKAAYIIRDAESPEDVIAALTEAGFRVILTFTAQGEA